MFIIASSRNIKWPNIKYSLELKKENANSLYLSMLVLEFLMFHFPTLYTTMQWWIQTCHLWTYQWQDFEMQSDCEMSRLWSRNAARVSLKFWSTMRHWQKKNDRWKLICLYFWLLTWQQTLFGYFLGLPVTVSHWLVACKSIVLHAQAICPNLPVDLLSSDA